MRNAELLADEDMFQRECLEMIFQFLENRSGKFKINKSIQRLVKHLYYKYGLCRREIYSQLWWTFRKRNRHLKYEPEKSSLGTFIAWFVYYELLSLKKQCDQNLQKCRTVPLSEIENGQKISRSGCSLWPYERQGFDGLVNSVTPEDELIGMELLREAQEFFGYNDLSVLLGATDRHDEADRLGIDYYTYCKRLNRNILQFRSHLKNIGYTD